MRNPRLRNKIERAVLSFWNKKSLLNYLLLPFSWVFQLSSYCRYLWFVKIKSSAHHFVPIIVVGNITLGGTGKTPLVDWLIKQLIQKGYHPGVVMRGYGGKLKRHQVKRVEYVSDAELIGDEAVLLFKRNRVPIMVGKDRVAAAHVLLKEHPEINIIISDDGMQHYALNRDIEIAVMDGIKRVGNGFCLPAGPLRESPKRLKKVDFVVTNGPAKDNEWPMLACFGNVVYKVSEPSVTRLLAHFSNQKVHAVAGIGDPGRFFSMLSAINVQVIPHPFQDHHVFLEKDLEFGDNLPILMTEKDAVKCHHFVPSNAWSVPLNINISEEFVEKIIRKLHGR